MTSPDAITFFRKAFPGQHDSESDTVFIVRDATLLDRQNVWNVVRTNRMSPSLAVTIWRAAAQHGRIHPREFVPFLHAGQLAAWRELVDAGLFS